MVDNAVLATGLVVILVGIGLILLGGVAVVVYEGIQRRLDARAGVPAPGEGRPRADAAAAGPSSPGTPAEPTEADGAREHQPA